MALTRAALFLSAALLPSPLLAAPPAAPATEAAAAAAPVKPLQFEQRTLANGLRVFTIHDASTATAAVQVWYDVGSKDDPAGRSGFAHMFEHLMFKGTRNLLPEQMDRLTEDVGGYNNASTNDDYTNYYEVVPAHHLERLLFAEADRMKSLVVDQAVFDSERDVVKEELRSRILAQPYGKLFGMYLPQISYSRHPYARPGIGSIADLDAATIDDIRAFHATYYRPDNAVLVVAGNFDPAQVDRWIDRYFADIPRPDRPIPRVAVTEPERTRPSSYTVYEENTPLPAVALSFPLPPDNDPDTPALAVLDGILSSGRNSRLYQSLVYERQLAQDASAWMDTKQSTGTYVVYSIMAGGKTAEAGEAALREQIARLRDAPVTAAELAEAKNEIVTGAIQRRETAEGKAFALASSVIIDGDPRASDRQLAAIQRVTAADVQRVARKYLTDTRSAAIRYLPKEAAPAPDAGDTVKVADTVVAAPLVAPPGIAIVTPAPEGQRVTPPAPGAPVAPVIPEPAETRLANGMRLIVVPRHDLPLVSASLMALGGGRNDSPGKAGANSLMSELLIKGTRTRSATEIAAAIERLGGAIDSGVSRDGSGISLTVKADAAPDALAILADVARNPVFAPEELERARTQAVDAVTVSLQNPGTLAALTANRAVFGNGPYAHPLGGTPTSLARITRADIVSAYAQSWRPDQSALILVGDITVARARTLATRLFADWKASGTPVATVMNLPRPIPRTIVVDMPDAGQAGVVLARPGIAHDDPRYYPVQLANATLGLGFTSRLNREIRIKRGLAYGAGSSAAARRLGGVIAASTQTKNASAPEVVALIRGEMERLATEAPDAAELDTRKAVLIGGFARAIETNSGIAGTLGDYVLDAVPVDELGRYIPSIQAVSPTQVAEAGRLFDPSAASIVVVGKAGDFADALRKTWPDLTVIPAVDLNLDTPELRAAAAPAPAAP